MADVTGLAVVRLQLDGNRGGDFRLIGLLRRYRAILCRGGSLGTVRRPSAHGRAGNAEGDPTSVAC